MGQVEHDPLVCVATRSVHAGAPVTLIGYQESDDPGDSGFSLLGDDDEDVMRLGPVGGSRP